MKKNDFKKPVVSSPAADSAVVAGRNAVLELLSSSRGVEKIYLQKDGEGSLKKILALAKEKKIPVSFAEKAKLSAMAGGTFHQGGGGSCFSKRVRHP